MKSKKIIITILILFLISIGGIKAVKLKKDLQKQETPEIEEVNLVKETRAEEKETTPSNVYVDIKGAVTNPGVYEIEDTKKVIDVINLAGGLTDQADTTLINLAKKVTNEMVVIIYTKEEVKKAKENTNNTNSIIKIIDKQCICPNIKNDGCIANNSKSSTSSTKTETNIKEEEKEPKIVNINTATKEELETIPGIGASKAEAIIKYREEHGPFQNIEGLKEVSGIGESLYEKVKDSITV